MCSLMCLINQVIVAGLPAVLTEIVRADDAARLSCSHHMASQARNRAQRDAEASKAKLYTKRKSKRESLSDKGSHAHLGPATAHTRQKRRPLSSQQKQAVAADIFKQLVGQA